MRRIAAVVLAASAVAAGGCGTFSDAMCGPPHGPFGYHGVRFDCLAVRDGMFWAAADIPFSAAADTVVLVAVRVRTAIDFLHPPPAPDGTTDKPRLAISEAPQTGSN